ncbi:MFS transporter [Acerihabitans arboris]|uniref:DHA2 family efflux MFS transporter permease subunit n=1 Tax=Acerihabitans arboris TaxID=2691583 RepID=A0A845SM88_9GAMM|nr:MFS transporter [Acerihabitans arboris]NDL64337.1 DHA2 family efflux MFS transporter permease subunit [Acerihabitans arboris]
MSQPDLVINTQRQMILLITLCVGMFMAILDVNVINIATINIQSEFHSSITAITWAVDAYNLSLSGLMLSSGVLADRFGARRIWLLGIALFTGASAGCGTSGSILELITLRLVQGIGAALFIPASFSLLSAIWPESGSRQRAIGMFGGLVSVAAAAGPVVGGFLVSGMGWRSIFLINLPIGLYGIYSGYRLLPCSPRKNPKGLDMIGQILAIATLGGISWVLIELPMQGWTQSMLPFITLLTLLCAAGFVTVERRTTSPMLPLYFFRSRAFNLANITGFFINVSYFGSLYALSLVLQKQWHYTPFQTGMALLPLAVFLFVGNFSAGRLMSRWGVKTQMIGGLLMGTVGYAGMIALDRQITLAVIIAMALLAGGVAFVVPPMTATVLSGKTQDTAGTASAIHTAFRQTGSLVGIALAGLIFSLADSPLTLLMEISALIHLLLAIGIGLTLSLSRQKL